MLINPERFDRGKINILTIIGVGLMSLSVFMAVGVLINPRVKEIFSPKALDTKYDTPVTTITDPNVPTDLQNLCATGCSASSITVTDPKLTPGSIGYAYPNSGGQIAGFYISNGKYYPIAASAGGPSSSDLVGLAQKISDQRIADIAKADSLAAEQARLASQTTTSTIVTTEKTDEGFITHTTTITKNGLGVIVSANTLDTTARTTSVFTTNAKGDTIRTDTTTTKDSTGKVISTTTAPPVTVQKGTTSTSTTTEKTDEGFITHTTTYVKDGSGNIVSANTVDTTAKTTSAFTTNANGDTIRTDTTKTYDASGKLISTTIAPPVTIKAPTTTTTNTTTTNTNTLSPIQQANSNTTTTNSTTTTNNTSTNTSNLGRAGTTTQTTSEPNAFVSFVNNAIEQAKKAVGATQTITQVNKDDTDQGFTKTTTTISRVPLTGIVTNVSTQETIGNKTTTTESKTPTSEVAAKVGLVAAQSLANDLRINLNPIITATTNAVKNTTSQYQNVVNDPSAANLNNYATSLLINSIEVSKQVTGQATKIMMPGGGSDIITNLPIIGTNRVADAAKQVVLSMNSPLVSSTPTSLSTPPIDTLIRVTGLNKLIGADSLSVPISSPRLEAQATALATLTGINDLVNSSNRLFYQTGLTEEEAAAYRSNILNPQRVMDAVAVGGTAVSVGDAAASSFLYGGGTLFKSTTTLANETLLGETVGAESAIPAVTSRMSPAAGNLSLKSLSRLSWDVNLPNPALAIENLSNYGTIGSTGMRQGVELLTNSVFGGSTVVTGQVVDEVVDDVAHMMEGEVASVTRTPANVADIVWDEASGSYVVSSGTTTTTLATYSNPTSVVAPYTATMTQTLDNAVTTLALTNTPGLTSSIVGPLIDTNPASVLPTNIVTSNNTAQTTTASDMLFSPAIRNESWSNVEAPAIIIQQDIEKTSPLTHSPQITVRYNGVEYIADSVAEAKAFVYDLTGQDIEITPAMARDVVPGYSDAESEQLLSGAPKLNNPTAQNPIVTENTSTGLATAETNNIITPSGNTPVTPTVLETVQDGLITALDNGTGAISNALSSMADIAPPAVSDALDNAASWVDNLFGKTDDTLSQVGFKLDKDSPVQVKIASNKQEAENLFDEMEAVLSKGGEAPDIVWSEEPVIMKTVDANGKTVIISRTIFNPSPTRLAEKVVLTNGTTTTVGDAINSVAGKFGIENTNTAMLAGVARVGETGGHYTPMMLSRLGVVASKAINAGKAAVIADAEATGESIIIASTARNVNALPGKASADLLQNLLSGILPEEQVFRVGTLTSRSVSTDLVIAVVKPSQLQTFAANIAEAFNNLTPEITGTPVTGSTPVEQVPNSSLGTQPVTAPAVDTQSPTIPGAANVNEEGYIIRNANGDSLNRYNGWSGSDTPLVFSKAEAVDILENSGNFIIKPTDVEEAVYDGSNVTIIGDKIPVSDVAIVKPVNTSPKVTTYEPKGNIIVDGMEVRVEPDGTAMINPHINGNHTFVPLTPGKPVPGVVGSTVLQDADGNFYLYDGPMVRKGDIAILNENSSPPGLFDSLSGPNDDLAFSNALKDVEGGAAKPHTDQEIATLLIDNGYNHKNIDTEVIEKFATEAGIDNGIYGQTAGTGEQAYSGQSQTDTKIPYADTASKGSKILSNKIAIFAIETIVELGALKAISNRDVITSTLDDLAHPGYYSPTLGANVVYDNGKWFRTDTGEEVTDFIYLKSTYFGSDGGGEQHLTINKSTFESSEWIKLEDAIKSYTSSNPTDINYITEAVNKNMKYHYSILGDRSISLRNTHLIPYLVATNLKPFMSTLGYQLTNRSFQNIIAQNKSVCFDFAAAEQTYLAKMGIKSDLGTGEVDFGRGITGGHAFLVTTDNSGNKYILDPTNNIVAKYDDYIKTYNVTDLTITPSIYGFSDTNNSTGFSIAAEPLKPTTPKKPQVTFTEWVGGIYNDVVSGIQSSLAPNPSPVP